MPLRFFLRYLVVFATVLLGACSGGGDSDKDKKDQPYTVSGIAANGPLDGATVEVFGPGGESLGSTRTDARGGYSLEIGQAPPYRVTTSDGQYNGQPYTGSLTAWCEEENAADRQIKCEPTPMSSVVATLMDRGYNLDEGKALLEQRYGLKDDPFTRELRTGEIVPVDEFHLAAARTAINNGQELKTWVDNVANWVADPDNSTPSPGTPEYTITLNTGTGGSGSPDPATVQMDEQAVFTLTADAGYTLDSASGCSGALSGNTYTTAAINDVTSGNGDCSVAVSFEPNQYRVSYAAGSNGSVSGTTDQAVSHGADADAVSAVADTGYSFSQWSDGVSTATRTDTNITGDFSATAQFTLADYTLTYTPGTGGSLSGANPQTVTHGNDGTSVSAVADTGHTFSQWSDGVTTATRTDTNVTSDISATAGFTLNGYTLTYGAGTGGSITGTSPQAVSHGSNGSSVSAVADSGYTFSQWSDGVTTASRTDTDVTGDISVTAGFTLNEYTLTYNADTGGNVTGTSPQTVNHGSDGSTMSAQAETGYRFRQWSDGVTTANRTDTNVTSDISVTAEFTLNEYTLTYSAGTGGSISGTSPQTVKHGSDGSQVNAIPASGYAFDQWSDGNATADRTDTNVNSDIGVAAGFVAAVGTPDGVSAEVGDGEVTVSWDPVSGAESYNLYYAADSSISPDNYASLPEGTKLTGVNSAHTVSGLTNGNTYYFIVTAVQSEVEGNASATVSTDLSPWHIKPHKGGLSVDVKGPTEAEISWPTTSGVQYNLYITNDPNTDLENYAAYGATLELDVTPTFTLSGLTLSQPVYLALEADGVLSSWTSFASQRLGLDDYVVTQVISNGIRYVGGAFSSVKIMTGHGVALPANGASPTHALAYPEINGTVHTSQPDGDGGWYIGGLFTLVGGQERLNLAHIDSLGQVTGWNPGASAIVLALAVDNGIVYAGGGFTAAGGGTGTTPRNHLAAFDTDGNLLAWDPGADTGVLALAVDNGTVYAGGSFTAVGGGTGTTMRNYLAAFDIDGNLLGWNPGADRKVEALTVENGTIYAGGHFTAVGGGTGNTTRDRLAAFDTNGNLLDWNPEVDNIVRALTVNDGIVYAGGSFTAAGGGTGTTTRNRLAAFDTSGNLLAWNPGTDNSVLALTVDRDTVYAGGYFTAAGGGTGTTTRNHLAAFDTNGNLLTWNPGADNWVYTLAANNGAVYAGGSFAAAGSGTGSKTRKSLAAFDASGNLLDWNPGADQSVNALTEDNGIIYAGGGFTAAGGGTGTTTRNHLAAFDANGNLLAWNPGVNNYNVYALAADNGTIYAGGNFTAAGGGTGTTTRNNLAAFDTSGNLLTWNPGTDRPVSALTVDNGTVYAGGSFTAAGGGTGTTTRNNLAAFDANGSLLAWNPGANSGVQTLVVDNGTIYAGGYFTAAGGGTGDTTRNRLAAFDSSGNLLAWNPGTNSVVQALTVDSSTIYAGGRFTAAGGGTGTTTRNNLAAFDTSGNLLAWNPGANFRVAVLTAENGTVYAGGYFTAAGGGTATTLRGRLAAFDLDGNLLNQ